MTDTRQCMLDTARDLLVDGGPSALSMRKVAKACGVSATAIYRHFDNKDALVVEALQYGFQTFSAYLMDALREPTALERFRSSGQRYFDFAEEHPRTYAMMFVIDCREIGLSSVDERSKEEMDSTFQFLVDRIAECQREARFVDGEPRMLAAGAWACMHGLASLRVTGRLGDDEVPFPTMVEQHLAMIERSLIKPS